MLTLYWIPRKRAEPRQFFLAVIEKQLPMGIQNVRAKNFPVNKDVDLYTLRLLIPPKACFKVRNSMFATHCTVDTLDVVHTGCHAVAISVYPVSDDSHKTIPRVRWQSQDCTPCQMTVTRLYPMSDDSHKTVPRVRWQSQDYTLCQLTVTRLYPVSADVVRHSCLFCWWSSSL